MSRKTALVTGASAGIGYELAKVIAKDDCNLVLVARTKKKLDDLATELKQNYGIEVYVIAKDLSQENATKEIFEELQKKKIPIDILVNNAGLGHLGRFADCNFEKDMQLIKLNIVALTQLSKLFVKEMIARKWGRILNVASIAAFQPGPNMAIYFASKAYVLSFSEAIAQELKGTGVSVTALCPGITKTEFFEPAEVATSELVEKIIMQTAEEVAVSGYKALKAGKTVHITGLINNLSARTVPFIPHQILTPMTDWMMGYFGKEH